MSARAPMQRRPLRAPITSSTQFPFSTASSFSGCAACSVPGVLAFSLNAQKCQCEPCAACCKETPTIGVKWVLILSEPHVRRPDIPFSSGAAGCDPEDDADALAEQGARGTTPEAAARRAQRVFRFPHNHPAVRRRQNELDGLALPRRWARAATCPKSS